MSRGTRFTSRSTISCVRGDPNYLPLLLALLDAATDAVCVHFVPARF